MRDKSAFLRETSVSSTKMRQIRLPSSFEVVVRLVSPEGSDSDGERKDAVDTHAYIRQHAPTICDALTTELRNKPRNKLQWCDSLKVVQLERLRERPFVQRFPIDLNGLAEELYESKQKRESVRCIATVEADAGE
jgi:hypothetical protein